MKKLALFWGFLLMSLVLGSCGDKEEGPASTLTIRSITPTAGSVVSRTTVINAHLNYAVADRDTSTEGAYLVDMLISYEKKGVAPEFFLKTRRVLQYHKDIATLTYALAESWDRAEPDHHFTRPFTCYFRLASLKNGIAYPVAETEKIVFAE